MAQIEFLTMPLGDRFLLLSVNMLLKLDFSILDNHFFILLGSGLFLSCGVVRNQGFLLVAGNRALL